MLRPSSRSSPASSSDCLNDLYAATSHSDTNKPVAPDRILGAWHSWVATPRDPTQGLKGPKSRSEAYEGTAIKNENKNDSAGREATN